MVAGKQRRNNCCTLPRTYTTSPGTKPPKEAATDFLGAQLEAPEPSRLLPLPASPNNMELLDLVVAIMLAENYRSNSPSTLPIKSPVCNAHWTGPETSEGLCCQFCQGAYTESLITLITLQIRSGRGEQEEILAVIIILPRTHTHTRTPKKNCTTLPLKQQLS